MHSQESTRVIKSLQEGLGGIRDVLIDGNQETFCAIYRSADFQCVAPARNTFIGASPRFIMEMLGMVMIAALAYNMAQRESGVSAALPVLGALALGAQRLLPVLQQGYNALATLFGAEASLRDGLDLLAQPMPKHAGEDHFSPLPFEHSIQLNDVGFHYGVGGAWIMRHVNLKIPKENVLGLLVGRGLERVHC